MSNIEQLLWHLLAFVLKRECTWSFRGNRGKTHSYLTRFKGYHRLIGTMQGACSAFVYRNEGLSFIECQNSLPIWQYLHHETWQSVYEEGSIKTISNRDPILNQNKEKEAYFWSASYTGLVCVCVCVCVWYVRVQTAEPLLSHTV